MRIFLGYEDEVDDISDFGKAISAVGTSPMNGINTSPFSLFFW